MMHELLRVFGLVHDPEPAHVKAFRASCNRLTTKIEKAEIADPISELAMGLRRTSFKKPKGPKRSGAH